MPPVRPPIPLAALAATVAGARLPFGVNPDGGDGEDGRLIFSSNVAGGGATGVGTNPQSFDGQRGNNVFIKGADSTALIADLLGGADMFGLLAGIDANATDFDAIRAGAPGNARAALARFDLGPTGYSDDYIGFDMLLFINLLPTGLLNPMIGVDPLGQDAGFLESLRVGGVANDPLFGGSGPQVLASLGGLGVYGTLISQNGTIFNASADGRQWSRRYTIGQWRACLPNGVLVYRRAGACGSAAIRPGPGWPPPRSAVAETTGSPGRLRDR